jgi:hypothetical protein
MLTAQRKEVLRAIYVPLRRGAGRRVSAVASTQSERVARRGQRRTAHYDPGTGTVQRGSRPITKQRISGIRAVSGSGTAGEGRNARLDAARPHQRRCHVGIPSARP